MLIWRGPGGIVGSLSIEMLIASALQQRGSTVHFILCDGLLSGCLCRTTLDDVPLDRWSDRCQRCYGNGMAMLEAAGFSACGLGEFVPDSARREFRNTANDTDLGEIRDYVFRGIRCGEYAESSSLRYFKGHHGDPMEAEKVLREYFYSSLAVAEAAVRALERQSPNRVFMQHGIYADWGPAFDAALERDIPVVRWMRGYLKNHLFLRTATRGDTRHMYYFGDSTWDRLNERSLGAAERSKLGAYMEMRSSSRQTSQLLFSELPDEVEALRARFDLPADRPVWALFTHLDWDAVFAFEPMLFSDTTEWLLETVDRLRSLRDVTWIIKVHPAERVLGTAHGAEGAIRERFPELPSHIRLIPADSGVNTYGILSLLDGGLTIRGTVGLELAMLGKPTILAGEAHYANRGFTIDCRSKEEYFDRLSGAHRIGRLKDDQRDKAARYAYHFFLERQLAFPQVSDNGNRLAIEDWRDMAPGRDPAMDCICRELARGGEFILEANR